MGVVYPGLMMHLSRFQISLFHHIIGVTIRYDVQNDHSRIICCIGCVCLHAAADHPEPVFVGQLQCFTLWELRVASDNFHPKNVLGRGGFGKVYKGRLADGSVVAIKRLKEEYSPGGERQFQAEVLYIYVSSSPRI